MEWCHYCPTGVPHTTPMQCSGQDTSHFQRLRLQWPLRVVPRAFSDIFEEQGFTWDVFNGGFGLLNRWGVRKPVFNAFKLLNDAGLRRWNVSGVELAQGGSGIVAFASRASDGSIHIIVSNHEVGDANLTIKILNAQNVSQHRNAQAKLVATVARIDDTRANAYTAWLKMGSPKANDNGILDPTIVSTLHEAARLVEEPLHINFASTQSSNVDEDILASKSPNVAIVKIGLPHHGIARVRLNAQTIIV